jgi:hypothetical protein
VVSSKSCWPPKQQQSRVELVVKLLRHAAGATLTSRSSANDGLLLRSVTALSSQATRQACSTVYQEKLEAARERDAAASKRSTKAGSSPNLSIWRLRHWAKSYYALQKDVQAGHQSAEDVEGLPAESAILLRTQPPRIFLKRNKRSWLKVGCVKNKNVKKMIVK